MKKGFTIIELIVVIAVIAVLAVIVMVNVTAYITKSKNSSIKGNMASMLNRAADYFYNNPTNTGANFISSSDYTVPDAAAATANGGTALTKFGHATGQSWCSCSVIYSTGAESGTYCVSSNGYKKVTGTVCSTRCPNATSPVCVD
jgi:prepilin-type N-terminal cleavage/methylation domain-containing protein